jgi:hypothetical protein
MLKGRLRLLTVNSATALMTPHDTAIHHLAILKACDQRSHNTNHELCHRTMTAHNTAIHHLAILKVHVAAPEAAVSRASSSERGASGASTRAVASSGGGASGAIMGGGEHVARTSSSSHGPLPSSNKRPTGSTSSPHVYNPFSDEAGVPSNLINWSPSSSGGGGRLGMVRVFSPWILPC